VSLSYILLIMLSAEFMRFRARATAKQAMADRNDQIQDLNEEFRVRLCYCYVYSFNSITAKSFTLKAALFIYDEGLLGDDKALAGAIWRRFFQCRAEIDVEKLELLVKYVRRTMSALDHIPLNTLVVKSSLKWLPLRDK
jgi:hypothetical protein